MLRSVMICFAVFVITSCSNIPDDEEIKPAIIPYAKSDYKKYSNPIGGPCTIFKSIKIPKKFEYVSVTGMQDVNDITGPQKNLLEALSLENLLVMTKTFDENDIIQDNRLRTRKNYDINLTSEALKASLGETGDDYVLSMFDLENVLIVKKKLLHKDTLLASYKILPNNIHKIISQFCANKPHNYLNKGDTMTVLLIKQNDTWSMSKD